MKTLFTYKQSIKSMSIIFRTLSLFLFFCVSSNSLFAQTCPTSGGFPTATGAITGVTGNSSCFDRSFSIGDNITLSGLIIGNTYTVSVCGEGGTSNHPAPYNSYIGAWNAAGTVFISESIGGVCGDGDDEELTFVATTTSHLIVLRDEGCAGGFQLHDLCVTNQGVVGGLPSCIVISPPLGTTNTWMGCVDSDWANGANWSTGVSPTASDVVYVPNNPDNPLIINEIATCAKMVVEIGGVCKVDYNAGGKLVVEL